MWIPTHNLNHHHFVNRPGDATATWRYTNKHNRWVALTYPPVSGYFQSSPIKDYVSRAKHRKPSLHTRIRLQYIFWIGTYVCMGILAAAIYHRQQTGRGLYLWFFSLIPPAICSSTVIMFFNYIQHEHTDAWSEHDHSRNFTGRWLNFLFFNNGYDTAHHEDPAVHWSELREAHALIADSINPKLIENKLVWFLFRQYGLALFFPSLGTQQVGLPPSDARRQPTSGFGHERVAAPKMGERLAPRVVCPTAKHEASCGKWVSCLMACKKRSKAKLQF